MIEILKNVSPYVIWGGVCIVLVCIAVYEAISLTKRETVRRDRSMDVIESHILNRNYGTPGANIVESLRSTEIEYRGVKNANGQKI